MTKKYISICLIAFLCESVHAQVNIGGNLKNKINQKANEAIDNTIDNAGKKKSPDEKKSKNEAASSDNAASGENTKTGNAPTRKEDLITYSKYDFIPGDKIIFEDNIVDEKSGEFPSKWDLRGGNIEIATLNGESVIAFTEGNYASIAPLMTAKGDYLPDVFSIEFDVYSKEGSYDKVAFALYDEKDYNGDDLGELSSWSYIGKSSAVLQAVGEYPAEDYYSKWHHMAISYNKGNIKLYVDQFRVVNLPRATGNPQGLMLGVGATQENPVFLKNIRIAAGGGDLYKRVATEGKIITHGILFEVGKSAIRPQSMGTLNEIAAILKKDPALKFRVDGHTDQDGEDAANMKLSQERAEAVKAELVKLGVDGSRLTTKGWGETKLLDTADTPEAKANNRRVEFVKQ